jgi:tetratricopeptide (TPR) repeat protein
MLLLAAAVFAGSASCRPCHTRIFDDYAKTPMARSSGRVDSAPPARFIAAGHRYWIENNRLHFDQGSAPLDYFIGSNTAGRSYLFAREGYLFELPVTWYQRKRGWDASPGYELEREVRLNRPIDPTCLSCHASGLRPIYGTQNRYADQPFLDNGVGCERCHGPGSEHVRNPGAAHMVNPAKLAAEERDSICAQCHLTGEARIERAERRFAEFRPGEKLGDYVTYFVWASKDPAMQVTSHVEKLAMSKCKRVAGDALWCGTCHDTHTNANRTQEACIGCHSVAHHRQESCAQCHMQKSQTVDVGHGVMTDHRIQRSSRRSSTQENKTQDLQSLLGKSDDRALGLAYAEVGDARARQYLLRAKPADAAVLVRLAALERNPKLAAEKYEAALREDHANPVALVNLGALYAEAGRIEDAARMWQRALEVNPAIEGAALNLARIRPAAEARGVLEDYLRFNPGSVAARAALDAIR